MKPNSHLYNFYVIRIFRPKISFLWRKKPDENLWQTGIMSLDPWNPRILQTEKGDPAILCSNYSIKLGYIIFDSRKQLQLKLERDKHSFNVLLSLSNINSPLVKSIRCFFPNIYHKMIHCAHLTNIQKISYSENLKNGYKSFSDYPQYCL